LKHEVTDVGSVQIPAHRLFRKLKGEWFAGFSAGERRRSGGFLKENEPMALGS
jgi:hypothetical protein